MEFVLTYWTVQLRAFIYSSTTPGPAQALAGEASPYARPQSPWTQVSGAGRPRGRSRPHGPPLPGEGGPWLSVRTQPGPNTAGPPRKSVRT